MDETWDQHVSPLMMGVSMSEMHQGHSMGNMHGDLRHQDMMAHQTHQDHPLENLGDNSDDLRGHTMGHQDGNSMGQDYYGHQRFNFTSKLPINSLLKLANFWLIKEEVTSFWQNLDTNEARKHLRNTEV
ncbi:hypothetical protein GWI33_008392 [Rhynchophorus ferrugineus]|uniref:Uncharacterized protein n=1 Tax=Rhynchophorus ferrugineus TaxID=354439 RepID=A0A834ME82_RHYFE|nr:hypothetical protein GWI33_008392 [Rhynchophorus ferrugineus]